MTFFWDEYISDNVALIDQEGGSLSYYQLQQEINSVKQSLKAGRKQLICIEMESYTNCIVAYLACLQLQYPVFLLNAALSDDLKQSLYNIYLPNIIIKNKNDELVFENFSDIQHDLHPELAVLLSTSGTTGDPKLVKLSFDNIQSNADSISQYLALTNADRAISSLPLFYSYGLSVLNSHLNAKASFVVSNYTVMQKEFWNLFKEQEVTSLSGVPYTYEMLSRLRFTRMNLPSLRYITQAGGKLSEKYVKEFAQYALDRGIQFFVMYGQTEATARISYVSPEKLINKPNSIGKAIPNGKLMLIDDDGYIIDQTYKNGELVYEGANVMMGYATTKEELSSNTQNKRLCTGDIAYFDEDGDFFIVGRMKRFIKLFGNRINLDQIEALISKQGFSCYCGGNDDLLYVAITKDNEIYLNTIINLIVDELKIHTKYIKTFVLDQEIPLLSNGKVDYKGIFSHE